MAKSKNSGAKYGSSNSRPVGNAGRGRHTGKAGYLGGKHRENNGCFDVFVLLVGIGTSLVGTVGYAAQAIF